MTEELQNQLRDVGCKFPALPSTEDKYCSRKKLEWRRTSEDEVVVEELELGLDECSAGTFDIEKAVCNHGFFMMAPSCWIPSTKTIQRPLRLTDGATSVMVSISQLPNRPFLRILVGHRHAGYLPAAQRNTILDQVARMLRISKRDEDDVKEFQRKHQDAKLANFGRLFRSPTLFEDIVKSILLCNCTWARSLTMAKKLCELQSILSDNSCESTAISSLITACKTPKVGSFPSPKELASVNEKTLQSHCKLGYRARHILRLAKKVESGKIHLEELEEALLIDITSRDTTCKTMIKMNGVGPFALANILMCSGSYQTIPIDTETIRHLQEKHGRKNCSKKTVAHDVKELYDKFAPFQCLAYWFEVCCYYENMHGKLSELPNSSYHLVTGSIDVKNKLKTALSSSSMLDDHKRKIYA